MCIEVRNEICAIPDIDIQVVKIIMIILKTFYFYFNVLMIGGEPH